MNATPKLTLEAVGAELRNCVKHLEVVSAHVSVCQRALDNQNADDDVEVLKVLRTSVNGSLFAQIKRLARLASKCDGKPVELFDEEGDDDEDDDTGGGK